MISCTSSVQEFPRAVSGYRILGRQQVDSIVLLPLAATAWATRFLIGSAPSALPMLDALRRASISVRFRSRFANSCSFWLFMVDACFTL